MANATSDRNLLFGILALQMDFIPRDALVKAMHAWVLDKAKPLGQILVEQQALGSERRALLEALVQEHVKQHDDDPGKSLASVSSVGSAHDELKQIADSDVQASLAHVPAGRSTVDDPYATAPPSVGAPSVVGRRFRILRPHARGGLGEVFVAQDEELHREVALKEIQERYADHPESRARFLVEAEITGGLEHPGIVPVYGLGQYADGRPFYAMRFIKGDSLKEAIERYHKEDAGHRASSERSLELRKLLGRFVDVCDAISYAHSRGVLHRDLKPGNVMLGKYGETLVVDWGLAKPVGGPAGKEGEAEQPLLPASADDSAPTQMGTAVGTPAFMPPEQAAGRLDQLGPASDVYSLGATLYCLLTGKAPFEGGDVGAVLQRVQRGDFPRPRQVLRDVHPALEAVCLKAMALRSGDRYPTPRALAGDIEKWLADERVSAWREPWSVRVGRWARRNQTLVAAVAAGVLVAILAGGAGALWYQHDQSVRAAEYNQRAANTERDVRAALEEAKALDTQAATLTDDPAKWGAALTVALSAVKRAEGVLNNGEGTDELRGRVAAQREALETADKDRRMIAALEAARFAEAAAGREGGFDKAGAMALYRAAFKQDDQGWDSLAPDEAAARINQRAIRDDLLAALAHWFNLTANKQDEERLSAILQATDPSPNSLPNRWNAAAGRKDLDVLRQLAASPEAKDQPTARLDLFARTLTQLGAAREAVRFLRDANERRPGDFWIAFELASACYTMKPPATDDAIRYYTAALIVRPSSAATHSNLGLALHQKDRLDEATVEYRKALQIQPDDAVSHYNLGIALDDKGHLDEAIAEYRKALQIQADFALAYSNLGRALYHNHQLDEAIVEIRKALQIQPDFALAHYNLGTALFDKHQLDEAIAEYRKAIQIQPDYADAHYNLALALNAKKGHLDEAVAEYRKALQIRPNDADAHTNLALALNVKGQVDEAVAEYRKVLQIQPDNADAHFVLGMVLVSKRDLDEAITEYRKAIQIKPNNAVIHNYLGGALHNKGQGEEAIAEYRKAIALKPDYALAHRNLAVAFRTKGQVDEAIAEYKKAIELKPDDVDAHYNLGIALKQKGLVDEAIAEYKKVVDLKPDDAGGWLNLSVAFREQGRFTESLAAIRRWYESRAKNPGGPPPSADWVREAEQWVLLDALLPILLKGEAEPASPEAGLRFARLCIYKRRYGEAIRFYTKAFAAKPALAEDSSAGNRYNAACAAALAGCGRGENAAANDSPARVRWRNQAKDWLRADLALWTKKIDDGKPEDRAAAAKTVKHWQEDSDLGGVRDKDALAKLPADEQDAWRRLWSDVDALRQKAQEK